MPLYFLEKNIEIYRVGNHSGPNDFKPLKVGPTHQVLAILPGMGRIISLVGYCVDHKLNN